MKLNSLSILITVFIMFSSVQFVFTYPYVRHHSESNEISAHKEYERHNNLIENKNWHNKLWTLRDRWPADSN